MVVLFTTRFVAPQIVSLDGAPVVARLRERLLLNPLLAAEQSCLMNISYPEDADKPDNE